VHRQPVARRGVDRAHHGRAAGHVALHEVHRILGGLQAQATGVVDHALAHEHHGLAVARPGRLPLQDAEGGRVHRALVDGQQAAHAQFLDAGLVQYADPEAGLLAQALDLFGEARRGEEGEGLVDQVPGGVQRVDQAGQFGQLRLGQGGGGRLERGQGVPSLPARAVLEELVAGQGQALAEGLRPFGRNAPFRRQPRGAGPGAMERFTGLGAQAAGGLQARGRVLAVGQADGQRRLGVREEDPLLVAPEGGGRGVGAGGFETGGRPAGEGEDKADVAAGGLGGGTELHADGE
jgi:hypothetical protein